MEIQDDLHEENTSFSPDLPGLQTSWDSTSLGAYKRCSRKYYYEIIRGYVPRGRALPLTHGIYYHEALEHYDRALAEGMDHEDAVRSTVRALMEIAGDRAEPEKGEKRGKFTPWKTDCTKRNRENLVRNIIWCLENYKDDPAETVILANGKPAVELTFKMEIPMKAPSGENMLLCGHMDRVVNFGSELFVMDHKTTVMQPNDKYWQSYNPDNQVSLYTLASTVVLNERASGVIISVGQMLVNGVRFFRRPIHRTQGQITAWLYDTQKWIERAQRDAEAQHWPMNDTACDKYGGCPFIGICSKDPSMHKMLLKTDFTTRTWDPMKER